MKEHPLTQILNQLAEGGVPADLDLRPAVHRHLETSKTRSQTGAFPMKIIVAQPRRFAVVFASAALFLVVALLLTPQGRAWSQEVFRFFTHADRDQYPLQPFQKTPPSPSDNVSPYSLTFAEAQELAGFKILEPNDDLVKGAFLGASFDPKQQGVTLYYGSGEWGFWLLEYPSDVEYVCPDANVICDKVGASAHVETVEVNSLPGEYVLGVWTLTENGPVWDNTPWAKSLRWQKDGLSFYLFTGPDNYFTKETLVELAESVR